MKKEKKSGKVKKIGLATVGVFALTLATMTAHELKIIRNFTKEQDEAEEAEASEEKTAE